VDDEPASQGENLAQVAQQQNSNLRRLIDAVGILISGSRALLARLQGLEEEKAPTEPTTGHDIVEGSHSAIPGQTQSRDQQKK
jgi:hypothetical protein